MPAIPIVAAIAPYAATALGASATTAGVVGAAAAAGSALYSADQQKNATNAAAQTLTDAQGNIKPVDIASLNSSVNDIAAQNAAKSQALEKQLTPEVSALKTNSINALLANLKPDQYTQQLKDLIAKQAGGSSLLNSAANTAQQQLNLGGALDQETQNQVMRAALAKAGGVGGGDLGLGRDISARDLGLTSLQLLNSRLNNAATIGTQQGQMTLQQAQVLAALAGGDWTKYMQAAQLGQSIQSPNVGLSPSDIANLTVGNTNLANNANMNAAQIAAQKILADQNTNQSVLGSLTGIGTKLAGALSSQATPTVSTPVSYTNPYTAVTTLTPTALQDSFTSFKP